MEYIIIFIVAVVLVKKSYDKGFYRGFERASTIWKDELDMLQIKKLKMEDSNENN